MSATTLGQAHKGAWIALLFSNAGLNKAVDTRMAEAGVVALDVYDVLLNLEEAPEHRLKMSQLAERVLLTKSGLTRVVDRLEKLGLVERHACPADRRAVYAGITPKGLSERARAWPVYERALIDLFAGKLSAQEAGVLQTILSRFLPNGHPMLRTGLKCKEGD